LNLIGQALKNFQHNMLISTNSSVLVNVQELFLIRLKAVLERNLANTDLNVEMLASAMHVSKSTLNRKLKAVLNNSSKNYIKEYRLQRAVELLEAGYKVCEVSQRVGFNTASYFTQCFKAYFKTVPSNLNRKN
jgi:AraC-like DNA-binding protein